MYLTRNQAGVYSASGVRIPPSPPDTQTRPPMGWPFLRVWRRGAEAKQRRGSTDSSGTNPDRRTSGPGARSAEGLGPWMGPAIPAMTRPPSIQVRSRFDPAAGEAMRGGALWRGMRRRCAPSPQALLCSVWARPFACLSPPLSGQPLNRGACCSRKDVWDEADGRAGKGDCGGWGSGGRRRRTVWRGLNAGSVKLAASRNGWPP